MKNYQKFSSTNFLDFLSTLNNNSFFNKFYNFATVISIIYASFLLLSNKINIAVVILDLLFFLLFSFELFVRYISIRNFSKFWKSYYFDIIALIGWVPLYYFAELALLRVIRLLRLLSVFKVIVSLDKKLRLLFEGILIIFVVTILIILIASTIIYFEYKEDIVQALKWSLYVIFTADMPQGLEEKYPFWIGMGLIMSNGILLAAVIGTVSSYIMEKFRNLTTFDNLPNINNLILLINFDKEIITSFLKYHFESSNDGKIKIAIVAKTTQEEYNKIITSFENSSLYEKVLQNTYIVNEDPLLSQLYEKLTKIKDKIKKIFVLPDERIENDYHKDTNVAFITTNLINHLGKDFSSRNIIAITITDIVNLPNVHILRSFEVIAKLINLKIYSPYAGFLDQFLLSFHNKMLELPVQELAINVENSPMELKKLIEYIKKKYDANLIGYIKNDGELVNIIPKYVDIINSESKNYLISLSEIQSLLIIR
ncbi:MAG: hypothetical protein ACK4ZM_02815 [bacterium]